VTIRDIGSNLQLTHFWSLAVEEQFYLAWPFLVFRTKSFANVKHLCIFVFLLSQAFRLSLISLIPNPEMLADFILSRTGELAAGGFLAISYRDGSWDLVQKFATPVFWASLLLLALVFPIWPFQGGTTIATFLWSSFLVMALKGGTVKSVMSMGWLRWVGTVSYGIYVFHVLILHECATWATTLFPHATASRKTLAITILDISVTLLLATLSFYLFERPILKLRKKFRPVQALAAQ